MRSRSLIHTAATLARRACHAALLIAAMLGAAPAHATEAPLVLGVFPYLPTRQLMQQFVPLREHLQQALGRPVQMLSAPDHRSFHDRTAAGAYDVVFTAPILGHAAEVRSRFQRIAMTRYEVRGIFVVPRDSTLQRIEDLRGRTLSMPTPWATPHSLALDALRRAGLTPGRDLQVTTFDTTVNSMAAVLRGDVDAGVSGISVYQQDGNAQRLRIVAETDPVTGFLLLAHPRVPRATVETLQKAVFGFAETPAGRAYFGATGHGAWLPVDDAAMHRIAPLARHLPE